MLSHTAFIGIGSNIGDSLAYLQTACQSLREHPEIHIAQCSPWYQSKAIGPKQADYLNGVIEIHTSLAPAALLAALQTIENTHGRVREQHWGPRTLDLDILLFNDQTIHTTALKIPHPFLTERNFVVYPLLDIAPDITLPNGKALESFLATVSREGLNRL